MALERVKRLNKEEKDPRFRETLGKLVYMGLLDAKDATPFAEPITLDDALWAGRLEPRILELIPALLLKKPKTFYKKGPVPLDLREVLKGIRNGNPEKNFRGIPPKNYMQWVHHWGHQDVMPSTMKSFRLHSTDLVRLKKLSESRNQSETEVLKFALKNLEQRKG